MDVILWSARVHLMCRDLVHRDFSWKPILRAHCDCNIAIRYNSDDTSLGIYHREEPAVAIPHDLRSRAQI